MGNILSFSVFPSPFFMPQPSLSPLFFPQIPLEGKKRGESEEGGVKNGEGKTEKLKMFPIFGGLPRL
jgi:hypothetical protein